MKKLVDPVWKSTDGTKHQLYSHIRQNVYIIIPGQSNVHTTPQEMTTYNADLAYILCM